MRYYKIFLRTLKLILFKFKFSQVKFVLTGRRNPIPKIYSEQGQDIIIFSILYKYIKSNVANFAFLDIGANDPVINSNSLLLEEKLGITTIAVEPQIIYKKLWLQNRPDAIFINKAIGEFETETILLVPKNAPDSFSSVEGGFNKIDEEYTSVKVQMTTINNILNEYSHFKIIGASIDVEGFEMNVLKGIDFEKYRIPLIIIENNSNDLLGDDQIRNHLIKNKYKYIARLGYYDDIFISNEFISHVESALSFLSINKND